MLINNCLKISCLIIILAYLTSCGSREKLVYFSDLSDTATYKGAVMDVPEPKIQSDDILGISVNTLSPETNALFNTGVLEAPDSRSPSSGNVGRQGYLVDKDGFINFPVIGRIKLGGLTKEQARQKMVEEVSAYAKDPIINVRFQNFRITVVGEVRQPSTFTIPNEKINVIEALGMAGDMTNYGRRENVLVIREQEGERTMARLNLNNKEVFNSPYFYLKQNDVVYVEPLRIRDPGGERTMRIVTIVTSVASATALIVWRLSQ